MASVRIFLPYLYEFRRRPWGHDRFADARACEESLPGSCPDNAGQTGGFGGIAGQSKESGKPNANP